MGVRLQKLGEAVRVGVGNAPAKLERRHLRKAVPFERRVVNLAIGADEQHRPEFRAVNPHGQVPVLVTDNGRSILESQAILAYLEERFPSPPLLPEPLQGLPTTVTTTSTQNQESEVPR